MCLYRFLHGNLLGVLSYIQETKLFKSCQYLACTQFCEFDVSYTLLKKVIVYVMQIIDFGGLLEHMNLCEGHIIGRGNVNSACYFFASKMVYMLRFLLKNNAHKAGTYLLQSAAAFGELITLDGVPLTADNLDLEILQQTA